jgi:MoaA/NifB/PqqE/SkfB family radical SAM enzyme
MWSCVVTDKTVGTLDQFVDFGVALGISSFRFMNLTEYPELEHGERVRHPSTLPQAELIAARDTLLRCRDTIAKSGGTCVIEAGILDAIDAELNAPSTVLHTTSPVNAVAFSRAPTAGQTRDCLDPWEFAYIHANRTVRPCCSIDRTYGSMVEGGSLDDVLRSEDFRRLRQELLSGQLNDACRGCPTRGIIGTADLTAKVQRQLHLS